MSDTEILALVIGVVVVVAIIALAIALAARRRAHDRSLAERYGSEYDHVVDAAGNRKAARNELDERIQRREQLPISPLPAASRERYADQWRQTQVRFVDQPELAVIEADGLVEQVMRERGYPLDGFDDQAALLSVDHADLVGRYRGAHAIADRARGHVAETDDLRAAFLDYRRLFEQLLHDDAEPMSRRA